MYTYIYILCVWMTWCINKKQLVGPTWRAKWWRYDVDISHQSHQHRGLAGPGLSSGRCGAASISGARKAQKYSTRASKGPSSKMLSFTSQKCGVRRIKHGWVVFLCFLFTWINWILDGRTTARFCKVGIFYDVTCKVHTKVLMMSWLRFSI